MDCAIEIKDFSLKFNDRVIFDNINKVIKKGVITGVTGLSGVGKTTLMRAINGNINNDANVQIIGQVLLYNYDTKNTESIQKKRLIGTVYQDPDTQIVFPNVLDEITFGMENYCYSKEKMDRKLKWITDVLDIQHLLSRNSNKLSGGEKQLIVLASILCLEPKILLLDECISQVDEKGRERVKQVLAGLKDKDTTIIMVEHNNENLDIADEILVLENGKLNILGGGCNS